MKVFANKSQIHGRGVFASQDLKKGEIAFIAKGKLTRFIVHNEKESLFGPNWMSISKDVWLDPFENNPLSFINHSCDANLGIKGRVTFVANQDIKKGEELTVDYSTIELDPLWKMKCGCGTKNCRKIIRSVRYLPQKTVNRYLPFVPRYILGVYNRIHKQA